MKFIFKEFTAFSLSPKLATIAGVLYMKLISLPIMSLAVIIVGKFDKKKLANETQQNADLCCI